MLPEKGEYERTVTTVVNAYVKPVASRYLDALRERLAAEGLEARARTVLVPPRAGVMSAVGLLATPPSYDLTRTHDVALAALDPATLAAVFEELEEEVRGQLRRVGSGADVVWPRLVSIADEMATTLVRTAHSHDVVEVHDMSTAIYDAAGTFLAMSAVGVHSHVYSTARFISALLFSGAAGRFRRPAAGRLGGRAGRAARILLNDEPLDPDVHGNSPELRFTHRDVLTLELPGGGGYGLPAERTPTEIEADVENGYVSAEAALEHYSHRSRTATARRTEESDER